MNSIVFWGTSFILLPFVCIVLAHATVWLQDTLPDILIGDIITLYLVVLSCIFAAFLLLGISACISFVVTK